MIAPVYSRPVFRVPLGYYLGLTEAESAVEPDHLVSPWDRIVREKLVVDVPFSPFGVVYRCDLGVLLVYSVSRNLKNDDPLYGIFVSVEATDFFGSRFGQNEPPDRPSPATDADVTDDDCFDSFHR